MSSSKSTKNNSIAKTNTSISTPAHSLAFQEQMELFTALAKVSNSGIKTPEEGLLLYNKARALGIDWAIALGNMSAINGKIGLNIHLIKGILSVPINNIRWEYEMDYEPIYKYFTALNDCITDDDFDPTVHVKVGFMNLKTPRNDGLIPITYAIDKSKKVIANRKTRIKFIRTYSNGDVVTKYGEFSYIDSLTAGLGLNKAGEFDPYSPWTKYPKLMIDHRAFTFGARAIASDLLNGCQELTELYDINNLSYDIKEDGSTEVTDTDYTEVQ